MEPKEALEKAETKDKVKELEERGYYLTSFVGLPENFEDIDKWILSYFNPDKEKAISVKVNGGVEVSASGDPLVKQHYDEYEMKDTMKIKELLQKLKEVIEDKGFKETKMIVTFKEDRMKSMVFTTALKSLNIDLNPETGEVLSFEESSMAKSADDSALP